MSILYSAVSRGSTIFAKQEDCFGNFAELIEQILTKIPTDNHKQTYLHGNYLINYITEDMLIYLCITDKEFERSKAFTFLEEIKQRFLTNYGLQVATADAYAMNTVFSKVLSTEMRHFNENKAVDKLSKVQNEIDEVKGILVKNIENLTERKQLLDGILEGSDRLVATGTTFHDSSKRLSRRMFWKNIKMYLVIGFLILLVTYVIISMACGGLLWQSCIHSNSK